MLPEFRRSTPELFLLLALSISATSCSQQQSKDEMLKGLSAERRQALESVDQNTPMVSPGIDHPALVPADSVDLKDKERVIGLMVEGHARAYPLKRMSGLLEHVVNDHVIDSRGNPKPFTVTYCNQTECVRVLEAIENVAGESLGIGTLGLNAGGLMLYRADNRFMQEEPVAALRDVPFELMTWAEWKAKHPDTEVYVGPSNRNRRAGSFDTGSAIPLISP